jgi:hypothetical protein
MFPCTRHPQANDLAVRRLACGIPERSPTVWCGFPSGSVLEERQAAVIACVIAAVE